MRLELNLPALERLIGGDTEVEVALRKQIVQEFAKRHLREVAEQATYATAVETTKQYVNEAAKQAFDIENLTTSHLWPTVGYRIKSIIETLVKEQAQKAVDEALMNVIKYQQSYWSREVKGIVDKAVNKEIDRLVEEGIRKRLEVAKNVKAPD